MGFPDKALVLGSDSHLFLSLHKSTPDVNASWGTQEAQGGACSLSIPRYPVFLQLR